MGKYDSSRMWAAQGGSGSTFVSRCLRKTLLVSKAYIRPDTAFVHYDSPPGDAGLLYRSLDDLPSRESARKFFDRSDCSAARKVTINEAVLQFVNKVRRKSKLAFLINMVPEFGFLTRNKIDFVTCLIRHPMHAYVSFTKSHRHPEYVEGIGGVNSEAGVSFFARKWKRFVSDCLESNSKIIRYEHFFDDARRHDMILYDKFHKFRTNARNFGVIDQTFEDLMYSIVREEYDALHNDWLV